MLKTDSKVLASQIEKECMARDATLEKYLAVVRRMENYFKGFIVEYIGCILPGYLRPLHENS
jgi:hypothetical protein